MAPEELSSNKDLLRLEHLDTSLLPGSKLSSICKDRKKDDTVPSEAPKIGQVQPLEENSVLSRIKAFLPVLDEANRKLSMDIKEKGQEEFDIEIFTENCQNSYVEMDLALGVADLCSPSAVSAAERLVGGQIIETMEDESSDSDSEDQSSDSECDDDLPVEEEAKSRKRPKIESLS